MTFEQALELTNGEETMNEEQGFEGQYCDCGHPLSQHYQRRDRRGWCEGATDDKRPCRCPEFTLAQKVD